MDETTIQHADRDPHTERRHRRIADALLVAAVVTLVLAVVAGWARTQLLDTDTWVETSRESLSEPEVTAAVSTYAVDQLFAYAQPEELVREAAPPRLDPLVGAATGALREGAYSAAERAFTSDELNDIWANANRAAHERFVAVVEGEGEIVRETPEGIRLDVRPLLEGIAVRLGLSGERVAQIPDDVALVEPPNSAGLERGIETLRFLDRAAPILALLAVALLVASIWVAPPTSRRRLLLGWGASIAIAGVLLGLLRSAGAEPIAEAITSQPATQDAMVAVYDDVTELLRLAANSMVLVGLVAMAGAWLVGPARAAATTRSLLAPQLRRHPVGSWIVVGIVTWLAFTRIPALESRQALGTLLLLALLAAGFAFLRRSVLEQVPEQAEEPSIRRAFASLRARSGEPSGTHAEATPPVTDSASADLPQRLERLESLHARGVLDDAEFAAAKSQLLSTRSTGAGAPVAEGAVDAPRGD